MSLNYIRVRHKQNVQNSILLDKIDRNQGNFEKGYLQAKQPVYVPFNNPFDTAVAGYLDMVPTDEVLLASNHGTIKGLQDADQVLVSIIPAADLATPVATSAALNNPDANSFAVICNNATGIKASQAPDRYLIQVENPVSKAVQTLVGTQDLVAKKLHALKSSVTIGTIGSGWRARVSSNSSWSNWVTIP